MARRSRANLKPEHGGMKTYKCIKCGRYALFGYNVSRYAAGEWYCAEHNPEKVNEC